MSSLEFHAHKFLIVDLVPESEMQTGRHIEECLLDVINRQSVGIVCERHKCASDIEFVDLITNIRSDVAEKGVVPYIHVEGHGSKDSLHFPDQSSIKWTDVFEEFRKINILSKNNLFFSSGACKSAYAFKAATITKPAPVFGMLAPEKEVLSGGVVDGFVAFYKSLIMSESLNEAFNAFADATNAKEYALIFSQLLFEKAAYNYLTQHCMGKGRMARLENIVSQAVVETGLPVNVARKQLKKELAKPQAPALMKFHKKFMLSELYPENAKRFPFDAAKFERDVRSGKLRLA